LCATPKRCLLVNDYQSEIREADIALNQPVGADDNIHGALRSGAGCRLRGAGAKRLSISMAMGSGHALAKVS
jgi:hypothetical protein